MGDTGQPPPGGGDKQPPASTMTGGVGVSTGDIQQGTTNKGGNSEQGGLYSDRVKITIARSERLKRNVLEINLESEADADKLEPDVMAKLFKEMGLNKEVDMEGFQLIGKRKLFVWCKEGVDLSKYCRDECYRVAPGVKTALIKPMDNKEVVVTIRGININTPDTLLFTYLSHFGKLVSQKVVYDVVKDGPLQGLKNGDRKFKMDFTGGRNMGTFHLVDGANVMVNYAGQRKTCGRCHGDSRSCMGGGWARSCEQNGGVKVDLRDHMRQLWLNIGFSPDNFEDKDGGDDVNELDVHSSFTPPARAGVTEVAKAKFSGVNIRNLPREMTTTNLQTFLEEKGLPAGHDKISLIKYKRSSGADIEGIPADICIKVIEAVNEQFEDAFDRKLFCSGISDLGTAEQSPSKPSSAPVLNIDNDVLANSIIPGLPTADLAKAAKNTIKKQRKTTAVHTPGAGMNSRAGLQLSDSSEDSDNDSTNSKTTKSKIKIYQQIVQREKIAAAASEKMAKRNYDQVSPQNLNRSQKQKGNSTSSLCDLLPKTSK